jgi:hypothetical protein
MKIPHGWKLVPIEPTEEMLKAACERAQSFEVLMDDTRFACDRASYAAAIAAAPIRNAIALSFAQSATTYRN